MDGFLAALAEYEAEHHEIKAEESDFEEPEGEPPKDSGAPPTPNSAFCSESVLRATPTFGFMPAQLESEIKRKVSSFRASTTDVPEAVAIAIRQGRQRRLRVLRAGTDVVKDSATQTDPIVMRLHGKLQNHVKSQRCALDETLQVEALSSVKELGIQSIQSREARQQLDELQILVEQARAERLVSSKKLEEERQQHAASQKQRECLEEEVKAKDTALQIVMAKYSTKTREMQAENGCLQRSTHVPKLLNRQAENLHLQMRIATLDAELRSRDVYAMALLNELGRLNSLERTSMRSKENVSDRLSATIGSRVAAASASSDRLSATVGGVVTKICSSDTKSGTVPQTVIGSRGIHRIYSTPSTEFSLHSGSDRPHVTERASPGEFFGSNKFSTAIAEVFAATVSDGKSSTVKTGGRSHQR